MTNPIDNIKQSRSAQIISASLIVVIAIIAGLVVYKVHAYNKRMITYKTECFVISVPANYKATPRYSTCQFSAYTGPNKKNPDSLILLLPYKTPINSEKNAIETLKQQMPNSEKFIRSVVGKVPAEISTAFNTQPDGTQKQITTYVIYGTPIYKPSGSKYATNAFATEFLLKPVDGAEAQAIIDSIHWK